MIFVQKVFLWRDSCSEFLLQASEHDSAAQLV